MSRTVDPSLFWSEDERACAEAWRAALDTDASLAVARIGRLGNGWDLSSLCSASEAARTNCRETLCDLSRLLGRAMENFPAPAGVFVRAEEREGAYRLVCRLLAQIESVKRMLAERASALLSMGTLLSSAERAIWEARWELEILEALAHPAAERAVLELRERVDAAWSECAIKTDQWREESDAVMRFSAVTLADFARQVSKNADFAHDGAACDPRALAHNLSELKLLCDRVVGLLQGAK